jgi:hypothetical protein
MARSGGELRNLVEAARARAMAVGWMAASWVFAAIGAMGLGLALLVWLASHAAGGVLAVGAVFAAGLAVAGARRSRARSAQAREALERAWLHVAGEVVAARGGELTAAQLAEAMRTDERHAEALLAQLSAAGRVRVEVRDDAELAYRTEAGDGASFGREAADEPVEQGESKGRRAE